MRGVSGQTAAYDKIPLIFPTFLSFDKSTDFPSLTIIFILTKSTEISGSTMSSEYVDKNVYLIAQIQEEQTSTVKIGGIYCL